MIIFEIIVPGKHLDYEDRGWCRKIENQLDSLQSKFFEANLALNLFISERESNISLSFEENRAADMRRKEEIENELRTDFLKQGLKYHEFHDELSLQTDIIFKREKWQQGSIPREFEHNLIFLYARAFLYALDSFDKFLGVLSKEDNVPQAITELHKKLSTIFPDLRGVRNTVQHLEDRTRGLGAGRNPKPMDLKPVNNGFIDAPNGGALILNNLYGSKFGSTMSDGHYGEVDVSPESMDHLQRILHDVLNTFKWSGAKQHKPS